MRLRILQAIQAQGSCVVWLSDLFKNVVYNFLVKFFSYFADFFLDYFFIDGEYAVRFYNTFKRQFFVFK